MNALIFPGQGAQYVGMGRDLYESFEQGRGIFEAADRILGFSLSRMCFEGPAEELTRTLNCQPAIFTVSMAAFAAFSNSFSRSRISVDYMAGLSLGEYSALAAAGALSFEDGLRLVAQRAKFMDEAAAEQQGRMSSIIGLDLVVIERIADEAGVEIANLNCPDQVVITGRRDAVDLANKLAQEQGAKRVITLEVSGAFHSSLMQSASRRLSEALSSIEVKQPAVPVVSNVTALPEDNPASIKENLVKQLVGSVLWEKSMRFIIGQGIKQYFEIGPGKVLKGLMRKIDRNAEVVNIEKKEDIEKLSG